MLEEASARYVAISSRENDCGIWPSENGERKVMSAMAKSNEQLNGRARGSVIAA